MNSIDFTQSPGLTDMKPREVSRHIRKCQQSEILLEFPITIWPKVTFPPVRAWRSKHYVAALYPGVPARLSINRTQVFRRGDGIDTFVDQISWDDIQKCKRECGLGDLEAVELYPADRDVVDVANMRHLWLLPNGVGFGFHVEPPKMTRIQ